MDKKEKPEPLVTAAVLGKACGAVEAEAWVTARLEHEGGRQEWIRFHSVDVESTFAGEAVVLEGGRGTSVPVNAQQASHACAQTEGEALVWARMVREGAEPRWQLFEAAEVLGSKEVGDEQLVLTNRKQG